MSESFYVRWPSTGGGSGGSGTVTSVSVISANGLAGTVATPTTTPAITLSTTVTGLLTGNGSAISAYTIGSDTLLGNNTGSTAAPIALTGAQTTALLSLFSTTATTQGLVPGSNNGGATTFLNGSGAWTVPPGTFTPGNYATSGSGDVSWSAPSGPGAVTTSIVATTNSSLVTLSGLTTANALTSATNLATLSALTSIGTIGTGTWAGTTVAVAHGGTGQTSNITAPTATTVASWDANKNISGNNVLEGFTSTVSSATPITLVVGSAQTQYITGSTAQSLILPVAATLSNNLTFQIVNASSAVTTVTTSGSNTIQAMAAGTQLTISCINTGGGTGTASWSWEYLGTNGTALPAAAGTLTGTTLASTVVTSSLTSVGTIGTGTWAGTTVAGAHGGTGATAAFIAGGVVYGSSTTVLASTAVGTAGQVLTSAAASTPTWNTPATGNYSQAYFGGASSWSTTSTTFADPTNSGGNTLTVRKSSGITLTAASSSLCGITFTPANNTAVFMIWAQISSYGSTTGGYIALSMTDGTTAISTPGPINSAVGSTVEFNTIGGIYAPATASAVTVKLQLLASTANTAYISSAGVSGLNTIEWTVLRIF